MAKIIADNPAQPRIIIIALYEMESIQNATINNRTMETEMAPKAQYFNRRLTGVW